MADPPGTVGRAVTGEIVIRDEAGRLCPPHADGLVWFRGTGGKFEYFGDPVKTAESSNAGGDESTVGDIGHVDAEGWLYLTDRKDHVIISGGVNVYPQEVETSSQPTQRWRMWRSSGCQTMTWARQVKALIQLAPGRLPGPGLARHLINYSRASLAHYKCPRSIEFVQELPHRSWLATKALAEQVELLALVRATGVTSTQLRALLGLSPGARQAVADLTEHTARTENQQRKPAAEV